MASTYSTNLKIELMGTGDQSGTWGNTTNTNLGTALEQAIVGTATVTFASADVTLTFSQSNASQDARALRLNLTGTSGGARNLILGSGCQVQKLYIINNGLADTVTVQNTTGSGIAVPAGKTMFVYNNTTDIVDVTTHLSSLTLGAALAATSGGTGNTSYAVGDLLYASTTTALSKLADVATGNALISGGVGAAPSYGKIGLTTHVSGTLPVANGGTGTTSTTYCDLTTNVTGILPVANGGSGAASFTANRVLLGNGTSAFQAVAPGTSGNLLTSNGSTWVSTALTAANVCGALAGLTYGDAGTFVFAAEANGSAITPGSTYSGADLRAAGFRVDSGASPNLSLQVSGAALSGTWRALGYAASGDTSTATLFVRIS